MKRMEYLLPEVDIDECGNRPNVKSNRLSRRKFSYFSLENSLVRQVAPIFFRFFFHFVGIIGAMSLKGKKSASREFNRFKLENFWVKRFLRQKRVFFFIFQFFHRLLSQVQFLPFYISFEKLLHWLA